MDNVTRSCARPVAKGYLQRAGIDYEEVFAPVAKYSTVQFVLAVGAYQNSTLFKSM